VHRSYLFLASGVAQQIELQSSDIFLASVGHQSLQAASQRPLKEASLNATIMKLKISILNNS
jgi:hypothetical protein